MAHLWQDIPHCAGALAASAWGAAPACPKTKKTSLPKPSEWAEKNFNFKPTPIQKQVLDNPTKRLILCCNRQWGKSTVIAIKALHHAIQHPNCNIVVVSRSENQGGELIAKVRTFALMQGLPDRRVRGYVHSLALPNGARIYAIAHSTETGPSRSADVLIYDEAALVRDAVFSVTLPFLAHSGGAIWLLSTPRGQTGFFYNFWHDNDPQWTRIHSTVDDCPAITPEFLELHRRGAPDLFRQEFYCEFRPAAGRLVHRERLGNTVNPDLSARRLPPLN